MGRRWIACAALGFALLPGTSPAWTGTRPTGQLPGGVAAPAPARGAARDEVWKFRDRSGTLHFTNVPTGDRRYQKTNLSQTTIVIGRPGGRSSERGYRLSSGSPWLAEPAAEVSRIVTAASREYALEPSLIHAVIRAESGYNPQAVSRAGACGLMQLMPGTAGDMGVQDVFHPRDNVFGGAAYLRAMLDRFNGDVRLALAAYNAGPGAVESQGGVPPYPETMEYVDRVLRFRDDHYLREQYRLRRPASQVTEVARR